MTDKDPKLTEKQDFNLFDKVFVAAITSSNRQQFEKKLVTISSSPSSVVVSD